MTTVEYLNGFLPAAFAVSMDEMTERSLADALDDFATARAREWCEEDSCSPQSGRGHRPPHLPPRLRLLGGRGGGAELRA